MIAVGMIVVGIKRPELAAAAEDVTEDVAAKAAKIVPFFGVVAVIFVFGYLYTVTIEIVTWESAPAPSQPAATPTTGQAAADKCLSGWDGHSREFQRVVKDSLADPGSFDVVSTKFNTVDLFDLIPGEVVDGTSHFFVIMTYKATNAYGGLVLNTATGYINVNSCQVSRWFNNPF